MKLKEFFAAPERDNERVWRQHMTSTPTQHWVKTANKKKYGPFKDEQAAKAFVGSRKDLVGARHEYGY